MASSFRQGFVPRVFLHSLILFSVAYGRWYPDYLGLDVSNKCCRTTEPPTDNHRCRQGVERVSSWSTEGPRFMARTDGVSAKRVWLKLGITPSLSSSDQEPGQVKAQNTMVKYIQNALQLKRANRLIQRAGKWVTDFKMGHPASVVANLSTARCCRSTEKHLVGANSSFRESDQGQSNRKALQLTKNEQFG